MRSRRAEVERLSGGRLGYAHIRGMNDGAYREIFEEIFGRAVDKEAIVLDTRFNGGGNLVEPLTVFLSGAGLLPRRAARAADRRRAGHALDQAVDRRDERGQLLRRPLLPDRLQGAGLGETVGMQVPGTCTSVWWERLQDRSLTFGIPEVGYLDTAGDLRRTSTSTPTTRSTTTRRSRPPAATSSSRRRSRCCWRSSGRSSSTSRLSRKWPGIPMPGIDDLALEHREHPQPGIGMPGHLTTRESLHHHTRRCSSALASAFADSYAPKRSR